ncbi:MAG: DUF1800 family protein [Nitrospira sp.]
MSISYGEATAPAVAAVAARFQRNGGDIPAVLRTLCTPDTLASAPPILKRPFDYAVSALRALNADTNGGPALQAHLDRMGQAGFAWPMPDGYPEKAAAWTGGLIRAGTSPWRSPPAGSTTPRRPGLRSSTPAVPAIRHRTTRCWS